MESEFFYRFVSHETGKFIYVQKDKILFIEETEGKHIIVVPGGGIDVLDDDVLEQIGFKKAE